ncbi:PAS domain S-box protein [Marinisporobacter balticus]|uniref:Circadian input-output histidine kinase CikA n=1 Tax=Marinisporobacter balticus TaxID=2018667 RepID=A0A4R2KKP6_9FIRM|nr:PAS domain S-box protein [Marinisporobacter balticus]TCO73132.1 PAS/PAC sensor hybrid histidine kinase [Marinisporobacter balticus]
MKEKINLLLVGFGIEDVETILFEIIKNGLIVTHECINNVGEIRLALTKKFWDIVIVNDHFNGLDVLKVHTVVLESKILMPVIILGEHITEDFMMSAMEKGVRDCIEKCNLKRLGPVVRREILNDRILKSKEIENHRLKEKNKKLSLTLSSMGDGVMTTDIYGNILMMNNQAEKITGWTFAKAKGKPFIKVFRIINKRNDHLAEDPVKKAIKYRKTVGLKNYTVLRMITNEEKFISASSAPILNNEGKITGVVIVFRDITRIRLVEEKLSMLFRAIEHSASVVVIANKSGNIDYVNARFTEMTGYTSDEVIGKNPRIFKLGNADKGFYKKMWETLLSGKDWRGEFHNRKKNGEPYWEHAVISPIKNIEGEITHYIAIKENITERKKMEEALKWSRKEAETANHIKSQFLANMSHEIRTPMNGIIGMVDLTLMTKLSKEQRENLLIIKDSADVLLNIINNILDFSKIEAGKMSIEEIPFNLQQLVDRVTKSFLAKALEKKIVLNYNIAPDIPNIIISDPIRLTQILNNLIGNAIKFTDEGFVEICFEKEKDLTKECSLKVMIQDTGIGIADEDRARLFKSFSQVDSSYTRKYTGTGLGLAISKELVELMGGDLWVVSESGKGSRFYFTIGVGIGEEVYNPVLTVSGNVFKKDLKTKRVLVVEDDELNQIVITAMLNKKGYGSEIANNGKEAILITQKKDFDMILMDIQMPKMDGIEATRMIRNHEKLAGVYTPIIALTAHALKGDREKFISMGLDGYVSKPIQIEKLFNEIEKLLKYKKQNLSEEIDSIYRVMQTQESISVLKEELIITMKKLKGALEQKDSRLIEKFVSDIKHIAEELEIVEAKKIAFRMVLSARKGKYDIVEELFYRLKESVR